MIYIYVHNKTGNVLCNEQGIVCQFEEQPKHKVTGYHCERVSEVFRLNNEAKTLVIRI